MRTKTVYVASDDTEWPDEAQARDYEAKVRAVADAMAPLGERPDDCKFSNGGGYLQHTAEAVTVAKRGLLAVVRRLHPTWFERHQPPPLEQFGTMRDITGRMLDDSGSVAYHAWGRLACIDGDNREWGQPYFSLHPGEGKQAPYKPEPTS